MVAIPCILVCQKIFATSPLNLQPKNIHFSLSNKISLEVSQESLWQKI